LKFEKKTIIPINRKNNPIKEAEKSDLILLKI